MLLSIRDLRVTYGVIRALDGVSIDAAEGEILSIIGANGAGKSTLLRTITGIIRPVSGDILFDNCSIAGMKTNNIVRMGVTMVPEGRKIFSNLSVRENLEVGGYIVDDKNLKRDLFDLVMTTFPRLKERIGQPGGTLSGGEQQMLAIGRALMCNPRVLLLDEPSMGLSPIITGEIFALIRLINETKGITMMLVEQNAHMALEHSHRTYVLENGTLAMEGASRDIKDNPCIIEAYLGV